MVAPTEAATLSQRFLSDILANPANARILDRWDALALPDGWLVAGCLFQTVWNLRCGRPPQAGIQDYDLFYFDADDLSEQAEQAVQARVQAALDAPDLRIEVCNQARVHLWYPAYFGEPYAPLHSARDGIDRFLVPSTCVGVRPGELYAPYGLQGLYDGLLGMNPLVPHRTLYARKVRSYRERWPWLRCLDPVDDPTDER